MPDANTIWTFREALTKADAIEPLFRRFDAALREAGYLAMSAQLVDATIVSAPKQRNSKAEKRALKEGRIPEDWQTKPAKLLTFPPDQGRVELEFSVCEWAMSAAVKPNRDGELPPVDIAIPAFGYQNYMNTSGNPDGRRSGRRAEWVGGERAGSAERPSAI